MSNWTVARGLPQDLGERLLVAARAPAGERTISITLDYALASDRERFSITTNLGDFDVEAFDLVMRESEIGDAEYEHKLRVLDGPFPATR